MPTMSLFDRKQNEQYLPPGFVPNYSMTPDSAPLVPDLVPCQACKVNSGLRTYTDNEGWLVHPYCPPCMQSPLCLTCRVNPKNKGFEFCSRICGRKLWGLPVPEPGMDDRLKCEFCHKMPKSRGNLYCSPFCEHATEMQGRRISQTKACLPPTPIPPTPLAFRNISSAAPAQPKPKTKTKPNLRIFAGATPDPVRSASTQPPAIEAVQRGPLCLYCRAIPPDPQAAGLQGFCSTKCVHRWRRLADLSVDLCVTCMVAPTLPYPCKTGCSQEAKNAFVKVQETAKALPNSAHSCLVCVVYPVDSNDPICKWCLDRITQNHGPKFIPVPNGHIVYQRAKDELRNSWNCDVAGRVPKCQEIWAIVNDRHKFESYERYKRHVEASSGKAHEKHLWFGAIRQCDPGFVGCCDSPSCFMCSLMRSASKETLSLLKKAYGLEQFGSGFYTARSASTAHIRSGGPSGPSRQGSILLSQVVTGRHYTAKEDLPRVKAPPTGYDSVRASMTIENTGKRVEDSHYIVYRPEAIKPALLVLYEN